MSTIREICYTALTPLSVISEVILLYGFVRLKTLREHPEVLIFWECIAQLIMDVHWFTGIERFKVRLSDTECQVLGAFSYYFYLLSWDYNLFLSIEILLKVLNPHLVGYKVRRIWYHLIAHSSSFIMFTLLVIAENNNGDSIMRTCFVQNKSIYELFVFIPAVIHFPLCIGITMYTCWISYNTFYLTYLKYHMLVVFTFAMCWLPAGIVHGINYKGFEIVIPEWFLLVI